MKKTKVKAEAEYQKNVSEGARVLMEKLEALYDSVDWRFSKNTKRKIQECNNDLDAYYTKNAQFNKLHDLKLYSKILEDEKALDDYQMRRIGIVDTHETDMNIVNQRTDLSLNNIISAIKSYNSDNPKIIALKNSLRDNIKHTPKYIVNEKIQCLDISDLPDNIKN